jgi:uncharacterized protein
METIESELRCAVLEAAERGDLQLLRTLAAAYGTAVVSLEQNSEELTTLHHAAAAGRLEVVLYLLSPAIRANARAAHANRWTALHAAAMHGHTDICRALLDAGADIDAHTEPQMYVPLHSAAFAGHLATIGLLLERGANRGLQNYRGETPAETAHRTGQHEAGALIEASGSA